MKTVVRFKAENNMSSQAKKATLIGILSIILLVPAGCAGTTNGLVGIPPDTLDLLFRGRKFTLTTEQAVRDLWEIRQELVRANVGQKFEEAKRQYIDTRIEWNSVLLALADALDFGRLESFGPYSADLDNALTFGGEFVASVENYKSALAEARKKPSEGGEVGAAFLGNVFLEILGIVVKTKTLEDFEKFVKGFKALVKAFTGEREMLEQANRRLLKAKLVELHLREFDCITQPQTCPR